MVTLLQMLVHTRQSSGAGPHAQHLAALFEGTSLHLSTSILGPEKQLGADEAKQGTQKESANRRETRKNPEEGLGRHTLRRGQVTSVAVSSWQHGSGSSLLLSKQKQRRIHKPSLQVIT